MNNFVPTDEQKAIIEPEQFSSAMIIANAGSGKTSTLVRRAINQAKQIPSWQNIAIISFTNKSADDILKKVKQLNGSQIIAMTFHLFLLHYVLAFDKSFRNKNIGFSFKNDNKSESVEDWLDKVDSNRIMTGSINQKEDYLFKYSISLLRNNFYIRKYLKTKFQAIYIDEAQDNNYLQYEIVELFLSFGIQIVLVGDPKQTIYQFRGADSQKFIGMKNNQYFQNNIYELSQNFRCHPLIDDCAKNHIIPQGNNCVRYEDTAYGVFVNFTFDKVIETFNKEKFSNEGLCFLFWSTNKNKCLIEDFDLVVVKIPDFIENQENPEYKNHLDLLFKLYFSKSVEEVYFRENFLAHMPTKSANKLMRDFKNNLCIETLKNLNDEIEILIPEHYQEIINCIQLESTKQFYQLDKTQNIAMTIHSAKGLEFRNVVLQKSDFERINGNSEMFYVACTRAEKRLFFV
ncbi:UvrD-helicase domain-containing protein [Alysiella crassa]|uniref:DNA 3'-5' helicase II n=1 Tax=Alysiella crassa TaxID=153491 RepID=A0A376BKL1_9NEIS|nr:UvrD-helicase domain-containing protein [Alysiella crassa]UOP07489.1 UvrD-helicase domain-containing protein [Alysiella crassa]SSY70317.1 ATP-dependent DNA helicase pcrA [Alysiella crassa]